MSRAQLLYLRRLYGLTDAQALAVAALFWGYPK